MKLIIDIPEKVVTAIQNGEDYRYDLHTAIAQGIPYEERPHGEYVDISKLRLMTVEECAGHTIDYAMGWKACIEWIKGGAV